MGLKQNKQEVLDTREALLEMYKAGFLDGYKVNGKAKSKKDFILLNELYRKAFLKRFEKQINKELKNR